MNALNTFIAASVVYGIFYCILRAYKPKPVPSDYCDMSADFDKIFRCVHSCIHFEQLYSCYKLIDAFNLRHPDQKHFSTILVGFIMYRERVLISKYSALETMMDLMIDDVDCDIAVQVTSEILNKGGRR
jgi:hypothetical protein